MPAHQKVVHVHARLRPLKYSVQSVHLVNLPSPPPFLLSFFLLTPLLPPLLPSRPLLSFRWQIYCFMCSLFTDLPLLFTVSLSVLLNIGSNKTWNLLVSDRVGLSLGGRNSTKPFIQFLAFHLHNKPRFILHSSLAFCPHLL